MEILTLMAVRFVEIYLIVFGIILAVLAFIGVVTGLGGGELFASSLKYTTFDELAEDVPGCLLGAAFYSLIITGVIFLCSLFAQ